jgi:hypothetical protein
MMYISKYTFRVYGQSKQTTLHHESPKYRTMTEPDRHELMIDIFKAI